MTPRIGCLWLERRAVSWLIAITVATVAPAGDACAQGSAPLAVRGPEGATASLPVDRSRGYAVVGWKALEGLGWAVDSSESGLRATMADGGSVVEFAFGTPLFRWNGEVLQLVDVPFTKGGAGHVPLQFVLDFLPVRLGERYAFLPEEGILEIRDAAVWAGLASDVRTDPPDKRVVIIDPGHGGKDPGTMGPGGRREKDIALAVGRALARELRGDESLAVHLTRDRDVLVPLWERGELATSWKGERPGIFVSIHVNALPGRPSVRGFETYFLSEARTEHERRVAANENAPLRMDREDGEVEGEDEDLGFILRELRNLDHQHWSSLLAEGVQRELETVHPGPSRGVKQGPFAVITNALMPAVLVEVGFVTNREEERALSRGQFQAELAEALARAIHDFFERYPPGQGETVPGPRP